MDLVSHILEFFLEFLTISWIQIAGFEHQIDGSVELAAGVGQILNLVEALPGLESLLRLLDEIIALCAFSRGGKFGNQDCWKVCFEESVGLERRRLRKLNRHGALGGRGKEGHLKTVRLVVPTTCGKSYRG
ncbi:MAG TPA: hypothetical protein VKE70_06480 [Candidatus Solibacter sp.]|nr:hypothetical protein [Candidatus Solibacter sp.]